MFDEVDLVYEFGGGVKMMYERQEEVTRMKSNGGDNIKRHIYMDNNYNNSNNRRRRGKTGVMEECNEEEVEIVDLSGMCLDVLPNPPLNLATISKLDLSSNNLQKIPESLTARLLNVIELDVHSNQLKSLPNSIGCLSKLKILNVSANLLLSLPRTLENCRSLEELKANFNQLAQLPETMGFELLNLKKLSVNSNKLTFLPSSTSHLTNLRILDARLNRLQALPDDLENLINLETLNVSQNFQCLSALPYSVGLLISLVELDVSYNKISILPDSVGCLSKLEKLTVEGNPLVSPPAEVMEQGLDVVKGYLCDKINGKVPGKGSAPKRGSLFGKLAKCGTFSSRVNVPIGDEREAFIMPSLASPRYMGMLSPKRIFSPKSYFSR